MSEQVTQTLNQVHQSNNLCEPKGEKKSLKNNA